VARERRQQPGHGDGVGEGAVGGQNEDGPPAVGEGAGQADERRRLRPGICDDGRRLRVAEVDLLPRACRDDDLGKDAAQKGEVALQQGLSVEDETALVDAGAPGAAAGEEDTGADCFETATGVAQVAAPAGEDGDRRRETIRGAGARGRPAVSYSTGEPEGAGRRRNEGSGVCLLRDDQVPGEAIDREAE
jgi:hypothetical protein